MERLSHVTKHLTTTAAAAALAPAVADITVSVTLPAAGSATLDGRLLLLISHDPEPLKGIGFMNALQSTMMAGVDVEGLAPGGAVTITSDDVAFPLKTLGDLPAGSYYVQAVLNKYETFNLSTGHAVKLPPGDQGDGQSWKQAPGNLFCSPVAMEITPGCSIALSLDQVMPPIAPAEDTDYIKHVTIKSESASRLPQNIVNVNSQNL